jgi:predicted acylesterase/phospholipase RssA/CRP-like cAMP-binding protein
MGALLFAGAEYDALGADERAALDALFETVRVAAGALLFRRGDPGDCMYVIRRGRFRVTGATPAGAEFHLEDVEAGAWVGEMAVITGQPRTATLTALEDGEVVRLTRAGFERIAERYPAVAERFKAGAVPHLQRFQLIHLFEQLFGVSDPQAFRELEACVEWRRVAAGEVLLRQGEPSDALYAVVTGRLRALIADAEGNERAVREIGAWSTVGELGLLAALPRSATVLAVRDSEVVRLERSLFQGFVRKHPEALMKVAAIVAARLAGSGAATDHLARPVAEAPGAALTIAVVRLSPAAEAAALPRAAAHRLAAQGETLLLDARAFDERYGRPGAALVAVDDPLSFAVEVWLREMESRLRYLVLDGGAEWSPWLERCVRSADRIVLVAAAGDDATPGALEKRIAALRLPTRRELVLLHPAGQEAPAGAERWLAARAVDAHHHLRAGDAGDEERLARRLSGRGVGVVFGGGGARGMAHIGAIRALEEAGIRPDVIGGTSIGALLGATYAVHGSHDRLPALAETFSSPQKIFDRTLPLTSLMRGGKVLRLLQAVYGERTLENLWQPMFTVSTNLTRAGANVHETGPVWLAVRKSMSIPGVFPPVLHEGDVIVDGAVVNNFPVDLMAERADVGTVIGVNVAPAVDKVKTYRFGLELSGWRILWGRVNPWAKKVRAPSLVGSILRAQEIGSVMALRASLHHVDLLIEPPVAGFSMNAYQRHAELAAAGYAAAQAALAQWQAAPVRRTRGGAD